MDLLKQEHELEPCGHNILYLLDRLKAERKKISQFWEKTDPYTSWICFWLLVKIVMMFSLVSAKPTKIITACLDETHTVCILNQLLNQMFLPKSPEQSFLSSQWALGLDNELFTTLKLCQRVETALLVCSLRGERPRWPGLIPAPVHMLGSVTEASMS